jgi:hypothetical protein
MVMLSEADAEKQIMLVPERKQWIDMKVMLERMAAMMERTGRGAAPQTRARGPADIRATGKSETIAGTRCEHYLIVSGASETDVCAATGLGWQTGAPPSMGSPTASMGGGAAGAAGEAPGGLSDLQVAVLRQRFANGFFPLKITSTSNGKGMTIEAVELTRKTLEDGLFQPPADYQEMRLPGGGS